jgi:hypothetical protein
MLRDNAEHDMMIARTVQRTTGEFIARTAQNHGVLWTCGFVAYLIRQDLRFVSASREKREQQKTTAENDTKE